MLLEEKISPEAASTLITHIWLVPDLSQKKKIPHS